MLDPSALQQGKMNAELPPEDRPSRAEKKALKQAEEAEKAFRASRGYEPDTFWSRLKKRFQK